MERRKARLAITRNPHAVEVEAGVVTDFGMLGHECGERRIGVEVLLVAEQSRIELQHDAHRGRSAAQQLLELLARFAAVAVDDGGSGGAAIAARTASTPDAPAI